VGVIFCPISEALQKHPELVRKYLGPLFRTPIISTQHSMRRSSRTGSFVYIRRVYAADGASTYFRINASNTGQFERTLIIADKNSYVSYLEGCTAPMRDENQLPRCRRRAVALEGAEIKYSTVQNWYPGDENGKGGIYNFVTKRGDCRGANSKISGRRSKPVRPSPGNIPPAFCAATIRLANSIQSRSPIIISRRIPAQR